MLQVVIHTLQHLNSASQLSAVAKDLIQRLLMKDPRKRLGCGPHDADEIKEHPCFQKINWDDLAAKKVPAPFKPVFRDELDVTLQKNSQKWISPSLLQLCPRAPRGCSSEWTEEPGRLQSMGSLGAGHD